MSCIDHFLISENLYDTLAGGEVRHDSINPSNHNVITLNIDCQISRILLDDVTPVNATDKCVWYKANSDDIESYQTDLNNLLTQIEVPYDVINCHDTLCQNQCHMKEIDVLCNRILSCCLEAGKKSIPQRSCKKGEVAGWREHVKPEKDHSLFWHWLWLECGKPNRGYVYDIMKKTRARYHYAVRCIKKNEMSMKKQKIAEYGCGSSDMWRELKKIDPKSRKVPMTVDSACGVPEIAELFVTKYEELFSSVPTDKRELEDIQSEIHFMLLKITMCIVNISTVNRNMYC